MSKRFKLKKYCTGTAVKEFIGSINDVDTLEEIASDGLYVAGWKGNPKPDEMIYNDGWIYHEFVFDRRYRPQNPDIVEGGAGLDMKPPEGPVIDFQQFGDVCFNLTEETRVGTSFAKQTTPSIPFEDYCCKKHEVVSYKPDEFGEVDLIFDKLSFNFGVDNIVFGSVIDGELQIYMDTVSEGGLVYSLNNDDIPGLPFAYLMEQPLNIPMNITDPKRVYGRDGLPEIVYSPNPGTGEDDNIVYTPDADIDDDIDKIYFNPFKLKNMYNYNWNMQVNRDNKELTGIRDYQKVGAAQGNLWLSYKYYGEDQYLIQNYNLVERIKGFYKYKSRANHKSNIYSIKIINSGLNNAMPDGPEKEALRQLVYNSVKNAVKKIAPASTQLWKIEYVGD